MNCKFNWQCHWSLWCEMFCWGIIWSPILSMWSRGLPLSLLSLKSLNIRSFNSSWANSSIPFFSQPESTTEKWYSGSKLIMSVCSMWRRRRQINWSVNWYPSTFCQRLRRMRGRLMSCLIWRSSMWRSWASISQWVTVTTNTYARQSISNREWSKGSTRSVSKTKFIKFISLATCTW